MKANKRHKLSMVCTCSTVAKKLSRLQTKRYHRWHDIVVTLCLFFVFRHWFFMCRTLVNKLTSMFVMQGNCKIINQKLYCYFGRYNKWSFSWFLATKVVWMLQKCRCFYAIQFQQIHHFTQWLAWLWQLQICWNVKLWSMAVYQRKT